MALPTFYSPSTPRIGVETITRTVAAARLELHRAHVDKMIRARMLQPQITATEVDGLRSRPILRIQSGELTVLRTDARREADRSKYPHDSRRWMGFHVEHDVAELEETSLRWWRSDPRRVLSNQLFVVTVATFPVAIYQITGHAIPYTRADEDQPRQHYVGNLLARVSPGMISTMCEPMAGELRPLVKQIMDSRITVESGGPIGYLEPDPEP